MHRKWKKPAEFSPFSLQFPIFSINHPSLEALTLTFLYLASFLSHLRSNSHDVNNLLAHFRMKSECVPILNNSGIPTRFLVIFYIQIPKRGDRTPCERISLCTWWKRKGDQEIREGVRKRGREGEGRRE